MNRQDDPWAAPAPGARDAWDPRKVAHLHRRAGFGATRAELHRDVPAGMEAAVGRLLRPAPPAGEQAEALDALRQGVLHSGDPSRLQAWWLYRVIHGNPLQEKMTLFWHNHFATSDRKVRSVPLMLRQNETLRRHALGGFRDLLTAMVSDPAMLVWLDGRFNNRHEINENFGREFLELFTLGVGHYTEADVRAAARAFTGWVEVPGRSAPDPAFRFDPDQHDDGEKTFLGRRGRWGAADVVRITLEQPRCAEFLCEKLYRFFVSEADAAPRELIRPLAERFRRSGYSVAEVVGTILRSRHFYSPAAYRRRVKCPVEFTAGLVRSLAVPAADVRLLAVAAACDRQGQELFNPPSVKGWDWGRAWVTGSALLERGNWVADVVWGNPDLDVPAFDPEAWGRRSAVPAARVADAFGELFFPGDLPARARQLARQAGSAGTPDGLRRAVQVLLHCPVFHLA